MKNKTVASWLVAGLAACTLGAMLEGDSSDVSSLLYSVGGILVWVFGIWAIVILYKSKE